MSDSEEYSQNSERSEKKARKKRSKAKKKSKKEKRKESSEEQSESRQEEEVEEGVDQQESTIKSIVNGFNNLSAPDSIFSELIKEATEEEDDMNIDKKEVREVIKKYNKQVTKEVLELDERLIDELFPESEDEEDKKSRNGDSDEEKEETERKTVLQTDFIQKVKDYYSQLLAEKQIPTDKIVMVIVRNAFSKLDPSTEDNTEYIPLKNYENLMAEFHSQIQILLAIEPSFENDFQRVKSFILIDQNMQNIEKVYIDFIRDVQKKITLHDLKRIFQISTVYGFSIKPEESIYPARNQEGRMILDDFKNRNEENVRKVYMNYMSKSTGLAGMCDFFLILRDMFEEENIEFFFTEMSVDNIFNHVNSYKLLLNLYNNFFFDYLKISLEFYKNSKFVDLNLPLLWEIMGFFLDSKMLVMKSNDMNASSFEGLKKELDTTLKSYERKLASCSSSVEKKILNNTINGLKHQLQTLDGEGEESKMSRNYEKKVEKGVTEIFIFYSKQQKGLAKNNTFDAYSDRLTRMSVGEWIGFAKDYGYYTKKFDKNYLGGVYKMEAMGNYGINLKSFKKNPKKSYESNIKDLWS